MKTYNDLLNDNRKVFKDDISTLRSFLFELCNEYNIDLYIEKDNEADIRVVNRFNDGIKRLLKNEPLNYVLGYSYFYGYKIFVNKDVLIPRFETEELVLKVLTEYDNYYKGKKIIVGDIGTGSGAIAIALKKEEDNFEVYASDISLDALNQAKINAKNNNASINFMCGSMLEPFIQNNIKLDILVSNPPYIKNNEILDSSVKDFEPHIALFGGDDGLKYYREIFEKAHLVLNDDFMMFFEIGYDQKDKLELLAKEYFNNSKIRVFKDINNKNRILFIKN